MKDKKLTIMEKPLLELPHQEFINQRHIKETVYYTARCLVCDETHNITGFADNNDFKRHKNYVIDKHKNCEGKFNDRH